MKLTIIGGGGLRTPMFVEAAAGYAKRLGLDELCLFDIDEKRLKVSSALSRHVLKQAGGPMKLAATTNAKRAVTGAAFVVTTIRVGCERGRVIDERVAIENGVIGQETTGPGGMAMAMRSIPAVIDYARLVEKCAPDAWIFNFTNPAGLVVQALRDEGFDKTIGICDSAENARKYAADYLHSTRAEGDVEVFGLNHLSYAAKVKAAGRDVTKRLLGDDAFLARYFGLFDKKWIRRLGLFPNEYLYYYAHTQHALNQMKTEKKTRGEQVRDLTRRFFKEYAKLGARPDPKRAAALHESVLGTRHETYMDYAWDRTGEERPDLGRESEIEGYAGVALAIMEAMIAGKTMRIAVNVPNRLPGGKPAIPGLAVHDAVEISCTFENGCIVPDSFDDVPKDALDLIHAVKHYETLTCHAVRSRKRADAVDACAAHPLVPDRKTAEKIVSGYIRRHGKSLGTWR